MIIAFHLPHTSLSNEQLLEECPSTRWSAEKISQKTGIYARTIASDESVIDIACASAEKLFHDNQLSREEVDFLLLGTQSGVYQAPSTACLVQQRLGLSQHIGALDFDLGCSGFVYGLSLAKGLLSSGQADKILLINADTLTKNIAPNDFGLRTVIGDAATSVLLERDDISHIGKFVFGTDGSGAEDLMINDGKAYMNGTAIYTFTLRVVPDLVDQVLEKNNLSKDDVDLFVFHQPNRLVLSALSQHLKIDPIRIAYDIAETGNTSGCTIPISLARVGSLTGSTILIAGFGIGFSWASTILRY